VRTIIPNRVLIVPELRLSRMVLRRPEEH